MPGGNQAGVSGAPGGRKPVDPSSVQDTKPGVAYGPGGTSSYDWGSVTYNPNGSATVNKPSGATKRSIAKAESKAREASYRSSADQLQQEALSSARSVYASAPNLRDQLSQVQSLWNGGSQEARAQADQQGLAAQRQSLGQLQEMARQGFNSQDEASLQAANRQANMNEQAQRQAVQQQAAMSGQRGGGLAMMGAMMAQQGGANRAAQQAADIGQARIAARQNAVGQVNAAGQNLAQQTFNQEQARGSATDAFNQAMMGSQQQLTQQNFQNRLGASQNLAQTAQATAQYNQAAADAERKRRNAKLNMFLNPMGGMK